MAGSQTLAYPVCRRLSKPPVVVAAALLVEPFLRGEHAAKVKGPDLHLMPRSLEKGDSDSSSAVEALILSRKRAQTRSCPDP